MRHVTTTLLRHPPSRRAVTRPDERTFVSVDCLVDCLRGPGALALTNNAGAGDSRGYGFVHYETQEAAQLAIEQINGLLIGATTVEVKAFKGAMVRRQVGGAPSGTTFAHRQTVQAANPAARAGGRAPRSRAR